MYSIKKKKGFLCLIILGFSLSGCGSNNATDNGDLTSEESGHDTEQNQDQLTTFEKDSENLIGNGIVLPDYEAEDDLDAQSFLDILSQALSVLDIKMDTSLYNPNANENEAIKNMIMLGIYQSHFIEGEEWINHPLDYGTAGYWLLKTQDTIQERTNREPLATPEDLIQRINVSTALHFWTKEDVEVPVYALDEVLEEDSAHDQPLTKIRASEILVTAYEESIGEIPLAEAPRLTDTDNLFAQKAAVDFYWIENNQLHPEETGDWHDWAFLSASTYDRNIRMELGLEETVVSYGAALSSVSRLLKEYEKASHDKLEEKLVLNERPYDWHVYQHETGDYSDVNCMPSCVEMALLYQGKKEVPSTEFLRNENLNNGEGWQDGLAETVMLQYGLTFETDWDVELNNMMDYLENGNILYVMHGQPELEIGHSVIIKGYWQIGDKVQFILSDPAENLNGRFGYTDSLKEAESLISLIQSHIPRYFIIPSEPTSGNI
ncbi:hypothetical protein GCM10008932_00900 [Alkalibacterium iburiense]|uniref:Peptidase C39-like domain-containing protein n=1 Tax=Alkalibacterium iburiense TaxID=290589 RepID=A0ABN0X044_9LACT